MIIQILSINKISIDKSKINIINNIALPDKLDPFKTYFINDETGMLNNVNLFKRRILGLTSYYRSAQEKLMPKYTKERDFKVIKIQMSDYQFGIYESARVEKENLKNKIKKEKVKIDNSMFQDGASTYIFSRAFVIVFPKEIKTIPKDVKDDHKKVLN